MPGDGVGVRGECGGSGNGWLGAQDSEFGGGISAGKRPFRPHGAVGARKARKRGWGATKEPGNGGGVRRECRECVMGGM